ncbi:hypothetical protein Hypma_007425 [Hypsizygus marmoreus]|uniref:Aminoglycoside phosphotransferase domain-containing protein n=1 Tax=Hypsizygus marmoreus TaxID=39966 RepID=A0A369JXK4_HYPMA|nr:hypothetical protein Hypma_007425 [Hypsizygus marmoreus]
MLVDSHDTDTDRNEPSDTEPGYVHSAAPDPRRLEPLDNPRIAEEEALGISEQKKYYMFRNAKASVFIKRNLTPSEYGYNVVGRLLIPYMCFERMKNEAAAIRYIQSNTTIPTPNIRCAFEDHGRYYVITDIVPGVQLAHIPEDKKAVAIKEIEGYVAQMRELKSKVIGGLLGDVLVPYRLQSAIPREQVLRLREAATPEFVFCHNDLSQHNVLVDETTFKVNAIIDWEFAGFFPPEFDGAFYHRPGPSVALDGEEDDVPKLLELLEHWKE